MDYNQTLHWMFNQLPMYQNKGKTAFKKDLTNTKTLAHHLNYPEKQFKSIHVGGTNGKGSTSHMLASVLQQAGYNVGLYTSPHLKDFRERIRINGKKVSEIYVTNFIAQHQQFLEAHQLSFFELTVGMAFAYFADRNVDIAIIEVGLGGRLDSTNIITPLVSVITNIGFDHMQFLGHTKPLIAAEKAGIIKPNVPVVIGETDTETAPVFIQTAKNTQSAIYFADRLVAKTYPSDLKGNYQQKNIKTVVQTLKILKATTDFKISENHIKTGLAQVVKNTGLLGRWQVLSRQPKIICDTAHNSEGLQLTMQQLKAERFSSLHIVFGVVSDKNLDTILPHLPKSAQFYLAKPNVQRGLPVTILQAAFTAYHLKAKTFSSVNEAFTAAKLIAKINDIIYVGGSTFVVSEIL